MKYLKATLLGSGALASLLLSSVLTSCQDEDFGYTTQEIRDSVYARNFENMYGKISEDQIWDFSSYNLKKLGLTGGPSNDLLTRGAPEDVHRADYWTGNVTVKDNYYTVTKATTDWLNSHLQEKMRHDNEVTSFTLKKTDNFYIIPIYQGQSGMIWDLELVDNNGRHRIWSKSENFQYTYDFTKWEEFFYDTNSSETYSTRWQTDLSITNDKTLPFATGGWKSGLEFNTSDLILGDEINIAVSNQGDNPLVGLRTSWSELSNNLDAYVNASGDNVNITITQAHLDALGTGTFQIQGNNVTINSVKRTRGGGNKGLKFERIFQYFDKNVGDKYAKACFEIPSSVGKLQGYFYIKEGNNFYPIPNHYFTDNSASTTATIANDGLFTFSSTSNPVINLNGTLANNGNQVDFTNLIGNTNVDGHYVGDHFENLVFHATSSRFNTYTEDDNRIKVIVKYNKTVNNVTLSNTPSTAYVDGHTINKRNIQTKLLEINSAAIEGPFKFNLYTTDLTSGDLNGYSDYGANHYSDDNYMLALTAFTSADSPVDKATLRSKLNELYSLNLPENYEYMVLSCEDADGPQSDHDYNDVIFLLVGGPRLPEINDEPIEKRYMIEDLGSTFDFDFNDIVVDVSEEHVRNLSNPSQFKLRQIATIRHLCGTIPFKVFLGTKSFGDMPMYGHNNKNSDNGYEPRDNAYTTTLYESQDWLDGNTSLSTLRSNNGIWNPDNNNIKVYVWPDKKYDESKVGVYWTEYNASTDGDPNDNMKGGPNHVYRIEEILFPNKGKFPYIIATDPTTDWMKENVSIPESWIKVVPNEYNDYNDGTSGTTDDPGYSGGNTQGGGYSWNFTADQGDSNGGCKVIIPSTDPNISKFAEGKTLKVYYSSTNPNNGPYVNIHYGNYGQLGDFNTSNNMKSKVLTADNAQNIQTNGLSVQTGNSAYVTKVTIE